MFDVRAGTELHRSIADALTIVSDVEVLPAPACSPLSYEIYVVCVRGVVIPQNHSKIFSRK